MPCFNVAPYCNSDRLNRKFSIEGKKTKRDIFTFILYSLRMFVQLTVVRKNKCEKNVKKCENNVEKMW